MEKKELLRLLKILILSTLSLSAYGDAVPQPQLLIFVSTSMPMPLLKEYYREAAIYQGILVFKGLPNGSFKVLSLLIQDMQPASSLGNENLAGAVIDDEAFARFGIQNVPSFVLSKEEECFGEASCKISYDKVSGNIGVKRALEEFREGGDMKREAEELLK